MGDRLCFEGGRERGKEDFAVGLRCGWGLENVGCSMEWAIAGAGKILRVQQVAGCRQGCSGEGGREGGREGPREGVGRMGIREKEALLG